MEKKKLRRRCQGWACGGRILPVAKWEDDDLDYEDTVMWKADPFASDVHGDYTKMWLCGKCSDASSDEI